MEQCAQTRTCVVDSSAIEAIILNINTNKVTATDGNGDFNHW
jgi:hypothetical protein